MLECPVPILTPDNLKLCDVLVCGVCAVVLEVEEKFEKNEKK